MRFLSLFQKLKKLIGSHGYGRFQSFLRGSGMQWQGVRTYEPTDDLRTINRKVSAKHDQLYTNLFYQEKDQLIHVFLDINANRKAGRKRTYADRIQESCADLALVAHRQGMKLQFFWNQDKGVKTGPVCSSLQHVYGVLKQIFESFDALDDTEYHSGLLDFLHLEKRTTKHHGIVIYSDFLSIQSEEKKLLDLYAHRHHLIGMCIPMNQEKGRNYEGWMLERQQMQFSWMSDIE